MKEKVGALLLGCALVLVLLECLVRATGAWFHLRRDQAPPYIAATGDECRILCIGESTTALGGTESWPTQLEVMLTRSATGRRFRVFNRGFPGGNTTSIMNELEQNLATTRPSVVVSMMGANDLAQSPQPFSAGSPSTGVAVGDFVKSLKLVGFMADFWEKRFQAVPDASVPRSRHDAAAGYNLEYVTVSPDVVAAVNASLSPRARAVAYVEQGDAHARRGQHDKSVQFYVQAGRTDPRCSLGYLRLANVFKGLLQLKAVEQMLKRAIEIAPDGFKSNYEMARYLLVRERRDEARAHFVKAVESAADVRGMDLLCLAYAYDRLGRVQEAEATLQRLLALGESVLCDDPTLLRYSELPDLIEHHRDSTDKIAVRLMAKRIFFHTVAQYLACYFRIAGNTEQAALAEQCADGLAQAWYPPQVATCQNYLLLSKLLRERGIRLVAVQYPGRRLSTLRLIFPPGEDVLFVDNEACFREAMAREGYQHLFWDDIYGDFGHCTQAGNRIIAENVARVILEGTQR